MAVAVVVVVGVVIAVIFQIYTKGEHDTNFQLNLPRISFYV